MTVRNTDPTVQFGESDSADYDSPHNHSHKGENADFAELPEKGKITSKIAGKPRKKALYETWS